MKTLTTFSGREYILEDDEAENIKKIFKPNTLLSLRSGEAVNSSAIESVGDPELIPYWQDYILDKGGRSFMRDGQRIFLETKDFDEVEYKPHPKYIAIQKIPIERTKIISNKKLC